MSSNSPMSSAAIGALVVISAPPPPPASAAPSRPLSCGLFPSSSRSMTSTWCSGTTPPSSSVRRWPSTICVIWSSAVSVSHPVTLSHFSSWGGTLIMLCTVASPMSAICRSTSPVGDGTGRHRKLHTSRTSGCGRRCSNAVSSSVSDCGRGPRRGSSGHPLARSNSAAPPGSAAQPSGKRHASSCQRRHAGSLRGSSPRWMASPRQGPMRKL
mmetsp:Transcript_12835/g.32951  ORF Transcript_12835/g.32951 Transcript_12835/m.32951 type:complete len:212 (-) Transcript_12835:380-1015(-)